MRRSALVLAVLIVAAAILGGTVFRTQVAEAAAAILKVRVMNTASEPVPVTLSGTPTVELAPAAPEPYQHTTFENQIQGENCTQFVCEFSFPAVPAGKRLVVTYASAQWRLTAGGTGFRATVGINGNDATDPQVLLPAGVHTGFDSYVAAGPLTLFANAGDVPTITVHGQHIGESNTAQVSITGYLVDVP